MLMNHAKIMHFFSIANDVTGRKKLQKMIYILKKSQIPFAEKFQFHFYGPYSEELTLRMEELCNLEFLNEMKEDKGNYYQYKYEITDAGQTFLDQFELDMPNISEQIELLKAKSSRFLELTATMLFFDDLSKQEVEDKVNIVKPKQKYTKDEMAEAWEFIKQISN